MISIGECEGVVKVPLLGEVSVIVTIKLYDLRVPSLVVDLSESNLNSLSFPSWDLVEDFPSFAEVRLLETSIHNDVGVSSNLNELDVVDGESVGVHLSSSFELEDVFSRNDVDVDGLVVDIMINWDNVVSQSSIPEDLSFTRVEGHILSASILEGQLVALG